MTRFHLSILPALFLLIFYSSCQNGIHEPEFPTYKNKLQLLESGLEIKLKQRTDTLLPSKKGQIVFSIGDITRGQTEVRIQDGDEVIFKETMQQGKFENFSIYTHSYSLECQILENKLIGNDYAVFVLREATDENPEALRLLEREKIEKLIATIEKSDIIFIRNGAQHSGKEAADHLRSKYAQAGGRIQTFDAFVQHIASQSSMSGKPYQVQLPNGKIMKAVDWYETVME